MNRPLVIALATLDREDAVDALYDIREILWPSENPDEEWKTETIEYVADVLIRLGLRPASTEVATGPIEGGIGSDPRYQIALTQGNKRWPEA